MSRIGRKPIPLPKGVTYHVDGATLTVKGPKGEIHRKIAPGITFSTEDDIATVHRENDARQSRAFHGLMRALMANMVTGVSKGYTRSLDIIGIGYKAEVKGKTLVMNLGFSHQIKFPFPDGISISVEKGKGNVNSVVIISGIDKEKVGQVAAVLRSKRPPDSYKGKGVRYTGEYVRLKAGKSGQ